jgi:hypothetical protein
MADPPHFGVGSADGTMGHFQYRLIHTRLGDGTFFQLQNTDIFQSKRFHNLLFSSGHAAIQRIKKIWHVMTSMKPRVRMPAVESPEISDTGPQDLATVKFRTEPVLPQTREKRKTKSPGRGRLCDKTLHQREGLFSIFFRKNDRCGFRRFDRCIRLRMG